MAEKTLYDAASKGDQRLHELLENDPFLLDRVSYTSSNNTPLHVASMKGHLAFVQEILDHNPQLAKELNSQQSSPLHIASGEGHVEIVRRLLEAAPDMCLSRDCQGMNPLHLAAIKGHVDMVRKLLEAAPDMCLSRDCQGMNPLHLAAMQGHVEVVKELVGRAPFAARQKVDRGLTVLHLCVNYGQLEALKILVENLNDLVNAKNDDGDTMLHMAVMANHVEIIEYLMTNNNIDGNTKNSNGQTPLNIVKLSPPDPRNSTSIKELIANHNLYTFNTKSQPVSWLEKTRDAIMVVAVLTATMAFQAGVSPAGGVWQDNNIKDSNGNLVVNPHMAGDSVMAHLHPDEYKQFIRSNTITFVSSLCTILLLISGLPFRRKLFMWTLTVIMWLTITSVAATYAISVVAVTPDKNSNSLTLVLEIGVLVWCGVLAILLLGNTVLLVDRWLKKKGVFVWRPKWYLKCVEANCQNGTHETA